MTLPPFWIPAAWAVCCASAAHAADTAVPLRDPMSPPAVARALVRAVDTAAAPAESVPRHLMVVDGRRYLIDSGRRLAVGDLLGSARIERIDDSAVWLREAGSLRQVSLVGGIVKRMQATDEAASSPSLPAAARAIRRDGPASPNPTLTTGKRS